MLKKMYSSLKRVPKQVWQMVKPVVRPVLATAVLVVVTVQQASAAIVPNVGTLNSGGTDVSNFAADAVTLLEFAAQAAIALTVVSVIIAVGWKAYRFFKPAR